MRSAEARGSGPVEGRIVSFDAALEIVLEQAAKLEPGHKEQIRLEDSLGRVLAEAVVADRDQPPFPRSTRDGFAVRAAEADAGSWLRVAGQVKAGESWNGRLTDDEGIEIMTGAPVPEGADAVVMIEHVEQQISGGHKVIKLAPARRIMAGENIVPRGSEAQAGGIVLAAGTELGPAAIALAAGCGAARLKVFAQPRVSILATGDELVDVHEEPGSAQIRNSNSYALAALVTQAGGISMRHPIAPDRRDDLERMIFAARNAELLLLSGGVSMGEYDLVEEVLLSMGAEFLFTGVKMQPGKPLVFGWLPARHGMPAIPFFGLPGNPVSTQVTFACFVEPLLRAMRGASVDSPRFVQATLGDCIDGKAGLTRILPARLVFNRVLPEVRLVVWHGSGDMAANARANCYAVLPEDVEKFQNGDVISVLLK
ncbi:molybdopterin molybdotransferase MoeA [Edaphobacter flagellatus]|uniref:molybdopterin molybdotransferase MoeA n=1 Tax=Edaphobacter flagellatus TaxID=1933044 RepID=UPI0021B499F1|nr:gephyrin-like molybdotransferase Glp [Edaphobacter flagellatus]